MKLTSVPPLMPSYIGICGASRAGKDSTAKAYTDFGYRRVGFADRLKNLAWAINPILRPSWVWSTPDTLLGREYPEARGIRLRDILGKNTPEHWEVGKDTWPEVRQFLIDLGNGCRDEVESDLWVRTLLTYEAAPIVVPDVRFLNEAECLRRQADSLAAGCVIVRVTRPGREPSAFEHEVNEIQADIELVNDGSLESLTFRAKEAMFDLLAQRGAEERSKLPVYDRVGG